MRCSSCEVWLGEYVDATLALPQMHRVRAHLRDCSACEALYREVRVVDGLLLTTRPADLEPDFAFAVMARVRVLPPVAPVRRSFLPLAAVYVGAAWIAVAVAFALLYRDAPHAARTLAGTTGEAFAAIQDAIRTLLPAAPFALSFVVAVLALDAALLAALIFFYRAVRPRLSAHLAAVRRGV